MSLDFIEGTLWFQMLAVILVVFGIMISEHYKAGRNLKIPAESAPLPKLEVYDDMPSGVAVALAWSDPGVNPAHHDAMKAEVRKNMPVLGRALDRMVDENS